VLRFIEAKSTHVFKVTLSRTEDGKKKLIADATLTTRINEPVFFSSGQSVSYVQSAAKDGTTAEVSLQTGEVFSGVNFSLDPTERDSDGSLNLSVYVNDADHQSIDNFTTSEGLAVQEPHVTSTTEHAKLHVVPGKPSTLVSGGLTLEVTAAPVN
jgi:hypothetical protein